MVPGATFDGGERLKAPSGAAPSFLVVGGSTPAPDAPPRRAAPTRAMSYGSSVAGDPNAPRSTVTEPIARNPSRSYRERPIVDDSRIAATAP